jgi:hypothetical protein
MFAKSLLFTSMLLVGFVVSVAYPSGDRVISSTDIVPFGDWSYDAMLSLAADGLVPGMSARIFQGDRLFDRMEMAKLVSDIIHTSAETELDFYQVALIEHLVSEFRPELLKVNPGSVELWHGRSTNITLPMGGEAFPVGCVRIITRSGGVDSDGDANVSYRASGFLYLSSRAFGIATAANKEERFMHKTHGSPVLDKAFVRMFDRNFVFSLGREYQNWGPVYSGSLILSDNAPAFWQVRGVKEVDFGKPFGRVKITQFGSIFEDNEVRLYLFGRRYEKPLSDCLHVGISETAKLSKAPNPLILVLPFYAYQHLFLDTDEEFNALYALDLTHQVGRHCQLYGQFLIDDVTSPAIFGKHSKRPRKTGRAFGVYLSKLLPGKYTSTLRAEYISIDRLTYSATREEFPELAYTHDKQVIGSPIGQNGRAVYIRGERYLSDKFSVIAEYLNQTQKSPGDPQRPHERVVSLMFAYDFAPDKSLSFRIAPTKFVVPGEGEKSDTQTELRFAFAF